MEEDHDQKEEDYHFWEEDIEETREERKGGKEG
jgi:hypothetical protein